MGTDRTSESGQGPSEAGFEPGMEQEIEVALEAALGALERGDPEGALVEAARISDPGDRALMEARAHLGLGMTRAASGALERAREALGEDDIDVVELEGEIALFGWDLAAAREAYEAILEVEPDAFLLERMALLEDLAGRPGEAVERMQAACELDPERPKLLQLAPEAFDQIVEAALAEMPATFHPAIQAARIVREPVPWAELGQGEGLESVPPDILGLFVGPTIHELSEGRSGELPPTIYLFQRNLERMAKDEDDLAVEIRVTLFHEIGHLLGLDEDEVAAMGLA